MIVIQHTTSNINSSIDRHSHILRMSYLRNGYRTTIMGYFGLKDFHSLDICMNAKPTALIAF